MYISQNTLFVRCFLTVSQSICPFIITVYGTRSGGLLTFCGVKMVASMTPRYIDFELNVFDIYLMYFYTQF